MKRINITVILVILISMISYAQSSIKKTIELTENSDLNYIIASSEKYKISELILSGYVNNSNAKYILDIAQKGSLRILDLKNVTHFIGSGYVEQRSATYYRYDGWNRGNQFDIGDYGLSLSDFFDFSQYNWKYCKFDATLSYEEGGLHVKIDGMAYYADNVKAYNTISKTVPYSVKIPRLYLINSKLEELILPDYYERIGDKDCSFRCSSLKKITLGQNMIRIGTNALFKNENMVKIIDNSSNGIEEIGDSAFAYCSNLTSISIPNSITDIGREAFKSCSKLTSIIIGINVSNIGDGAFSKCDNIKKVIWMPVNPPIGYDNCDGYNIQNYIPNNEYTSQSLRNKILYYAYFETDGINYLITTPHDVTCNVIGSLDNETITIPSSITYLNNCYDVTNICEAAFGGCTKVTSVSIPNSVTSIEESAFAFCSGLKSIIIPNSVTSIGSHAFWYCSNLTSVNIPDNLTTIKDGTFAGCSNLNSIDIPNSVTSIEDFAFYDTNIKSMTIGIGVQSISTSAFSSKPLKTIWLTNTPPTNYANAAGTINYVSNNLYTSLNNQKVYPFLSSMFEVDGIKYVPISNSEKTCDAFDCLYDETVENVYVNSNVSYKGVNMTVKAINPYTCYGNNHIKDVQLKNDGDVEIYAFYDCDAILRINLENSGSVGGQAFANCSSIQNVTASNNGSIGEQAFANCINIQTVTATNNGNIGTKAFIGCDAIKTVDISNKGSIGESAFENCDAITTVNASNKGNIGSKAFYDCDAITNINLTNSGNIGEQAFYGCSALKTAIVKNKGWINDQAFEQCTSFETCTLGNQVTSINNSSFKDCSNLQQIIIPESVGSIGDYAFSGCSRMNSAIIGNGVQTISQYAFSGCSSLTNLQMGNQVKQINTYAFQNCSALPQIEIPASVTSISDYTFSGCTKLATVLIANRNSELSLGSNGSSPLFFSCLLDSVYIGGNITYKTSSSYGYSPFYRNTSLRTIHITDKETEISPNEFYGCSNLQNVRIGDGVTTIGNWAFSGCSNLDYFAFGSKVETIGKEAFSDCTAMTQLCSFAETPPICGSQALDDINKWNCSLHVPTGKTNDYQAAEQWKEFFFINDDAANFDYIPIAFGDVNDDGSYDVLDLVSIVDHIMGRKPQNFNIIAADLNKDGSVNVIDLVKEVDLIISYSTSNASSIPFEANDNALSLETNSDGTILLDISDDTQYLAAQFVVTLSEGQQLTDVTTDQHHTVSITPINDYQYFVISYSPTNAAYASSATLTLHVEGSGMVTVENPNYVNEAKEKVLFEHVNSTYTDGICVEHYELAQPTDIYTTTGILIRKGATTLNGLKSGIYIMNGQKVNIK